MAKYKFDLNFVMRPSHLNIALPHASLRRVVLGWVVVRLIIVVGMGHEENEYKGPREHCSDASQSQMARKYLLARKSLFVNSPKGIRSNAAIYDLQSMRFYFIRGLPNRADSVSNYPS